MENQYILNMIWEMGKVLVVVVTIIWIAWRKVKEKRKLNNLAMFATIEAQKLKLKKNHGKKDDGV